MNGNLCYPTPLCRKERVSSAAYLALAEAEITIKESWELREKLSICDQDKGDEIIFKFLGQKNPNNEDEEDDIPIIAGMDNNK
eukprot:14003731-Ditylum_brightwellii.AAC.1